MTVAETPWVVRTRVCSTTTTVPLPVMTLPEAQFSYLKLLSQVFTLMNRVLLSSCKQIVNGIDCLGCTGLAVSAAPAQTSNNTHAGNTNLVLFMSSPKINPDRQREGSLNYSWPLTMESTHDGNESCYQLVAQNKSDLEWLKKRANSRKAVGLSHAPMPHHPLHARQ